MKKSVDKKNEIIKIVVLIIIAILIIAAIVGFIVYSNVRIPSEYIGVYTRYYNSDGKEVKVTYTIKPLSITYYSESYINGEFIKDERKLDYYDKDGDLIVKDGEKEYYVIIDDSHLYLSSNKDIDSSKKYKIYYWNEKGQHADEEEMYNSVSVLESQIEDNVMKWARSKVHKDEKFKYSFYILDSDEEPDMSDLNEYKVKKKASNGELSFTFDKKTKKLKYIDFYGSVFTSAYNGRYDDTMSAEDINDVESMLAAIMYMYEDKSDANSYKDPNEGLKEAAVLRYYTLLLNQTADPSYSNGYKYKLDNDDYTVNYDKMINGDKYLASGHISFRIVLKK